MMADSLTVMLAPADRAAVSKSGALSGAKATTGRCAMAGVAFNAAMAPQTSPADARSMNTSSGDSRWAVAERRETSLRDKTR